MAKKAAIQVGLLGFGTVGQGVYKLFEKNRPLIEAKIGAELHIKKILVRNPEAPREVSVPASLLTRNPADLLEDPDIDILVELVGGMEPVKTWLLSGMQRGKHVITANKAVLASAWDELMRTARENKVDLYFEASVGGGIPVIQGINEGLAANNITSLYGILNGTTNFILQKMTEEGRPFKEALQLAQRKGLAEADPTLDISGRDTAHKLSILASLAFSTRVRQQDVYVEGIERITPQDILFAREEFGRVVKLLAIAKVVNGLLEVRVHPTLIPEDHLLAKVDGTYNGILVTGDAVGPTLFYGQGAGQMPTASAVMSDLIYVGRNVHEGIAGSTSNCWYVEHNPLIKGFRNMGDVHCRYYLKFTVLDQPGVLSAISRILGEHQISISSVVQKERKKGDKVPVVFTTYGAPDRFVQEAIKKINGLPFVKEETLAIRMDRGE